MKWTLEVNIKIDRTKHCYGSSSRLT